MSRTIETFFSAKHVSPYFPIQAQSCSLLASAVADLLIATFPGLVADIFGWSSWVTSSRLGIRSWVVRGGLVLTRCHATPRSSPPLTPTYVNRGAIFSRVRTHKPRCTSPFQNLFSIPTPLAEFCPCPKTHKQDRFCCADNPDSGLSFRVPIFYFQFDVPAITGGKGWENLFSGGRVLANRSTPRTNCRDNSSRSPGDTPPRDRTRRASRL